HGDAALDRLAGAAGRLNGHGAEGVAFGETVVLHQAGDLHDLAAEADEEGGPDIGVCGITPLRPLHRLEALAAAPSHSAASAVDEGHDAIDLGIVRKDAGPVHLLGDEAGDRGGAVHAGQYANIVAGADLAVGAAVALEGAALLDGEDALRLG